MAGAKLGKTRWPSIYRRGDRYVVTYRDHDGKQRKETVRTLDDDYRRPSRPMELPHPDPPLADKVVALRPWRDADLAAIVAGFSDPLVHRFSWPLERPYTEEDAWDFLPAQEQERREGIALNLAFAEPGDEAAVLAAHATDVLEIERLVLTAAPDNEASMRVADRCGFAHERLIVRHLPWKGGWRDTVVFALRR